MFGLCKGIEGQGAAMAFIDDVESFEAKARLRKAAPLAAAGIAALALAAAFFLLQGTFSGGGDFTVQQADAVSSSASSAPSGQGSDSAAADASSGSTSSTEVCVYVTGAVKHPGVYRFGASARVEEAIDAAGGFTRKADKASLNLARVLVDGEQIDVQAKGLAASASSASAYSASAAASSSAGSSAAASGSAAKVNINQATAEELKTLDGVGDATAQKIIDYRTANGPFQRIEDIKNVSGIAEKRFEAIADRICV
jgi:competence protein ComEA